MNTNKHESMEKVVVSILEHTTQMLKTEPLEILKNALSCLSRLKNIRENSFSSVVPTLSVSSVCSVVKNGGTA
jgi:ribosomal protein S7